MAQHGRDCVRVVDYGHNAKFSLAQHAGSSRGGCSHRSANLWVTWPCISQVVTRCWRSQGAGVHLYYHTFTQLCPGCENPVKAGEIREGGRDEGDNLADEWHRGCRLWQRRGASLRTACRVITSMSKIRFRKGDVREGESPDCAALCRRAW